jgi:hypothetical protein
MIFYLQIDPIEIDHKLRHQDHLNKGLIQIQSTIVNQTQ